VDDSCAVLIEPLAAALHAVRMIDPAPGDTIAVLGPRRLGMLVIAALDAFRAATGRSFTIVALSRHDDLRTLAGDLGADRAIPVEDHGDHLDDRIADVVVDTTGTPEGLMLAVRLARREVHLKSTHGRPAAGVRHLTELVVDEIALERVVPEELVAAGVGAKGGAPLAWLASTDPPGALAQEQTVVRGAGASLMSAVAEAASGMLPRAARAVADSAAQVADAIRPGDVTPHSVVRPRGAIGLLPHAGGYASPLLAAIAGRGLRLTTSRCGDLREAAGMLERHAPLRRVGERMITHRFDPGRMPDAFATARSAVCIKAVVRQGEQP
jgi:threonine dehydrogenase-like Zn-dependent dehydrogenase